MRVLSQQDPKTKASGAADGPPGAAGSGASLGGANRSGTGRRGANRRGVARPAGRDPLPVTLAGLMVAGLMALGGCASSLPTEVTTFHQLPARSELSGRSFAMVSDPAQRDSLEHASYADAVRHALVRQGLVEAPAERVADYAVNVRYSTAESASYQRRGGSSVGVGVSGGGFSLGGLGLGIGIGIPIGGGGQRSTPTYRHELDVDLNTWGSTAGGQPGTRVFEGRAIAENEAESIASVMPALVEALFDDFPGANGRTRNVEVRLAQ